MPTVRKAILGISLVVVSLAAYFNLKPNVNISVKNDPNSLTINSLRQKQYSGSEIQVEEVLTPEKNYNRFIVSYDSEGLKIYALLFVPNSDRPKEGFPVIILNHGYIIPEKYTADGNYIAYADAFAKAGYIVFKPDYRGHGKSEGFPTSSYFAPDYIIDDLNAIASIKKYADADPLKIGVWGHSMGGNIALKTVLIDKSIKVASIWSGVVAPIDQIINDWQNLVSYRPDTEDLRLRNQNKDLLIKTYGTPSENPIFWNSIDPNNFLSDVNIPIQIQVGLADTQVPLGFSKGLYERLKNLGKTVEYYEYEGANHDIYQNFDEAMQNTIKFFDLYLK